MCFFCVIKGVASVGKVVYFTAIFPYFVLTALLIRAMTLEGSIDGVWFFILPEWELLLSPGVWGDASSQIFYSFGLACGSLVTFASYNKVKPRTFHETFSIKFSQQFKNNCHFDAVFVSLTNFMTAIFAGKHLYFGCFQKLIYLFRDNDLPRKL